MFNKRISSKVLGFLLLLPATLLLFGAIAAIFFLVPFGFASEVSFFALIPFLFLMFFFFLLSGICFFISIRYIKNKPFKENESLGKLFLYFGLGYFIYSLFVCLISNLTGNLGGFAQPAIAFLIMLVLVPLGLGLKNGYK